MSAVPYLQDVDFTLWNGDAREVLAGLPDESVHMCVTSPPFFGLRDYGVEGQIGLEATPDEWVSQLVAVFDEVRRVLRSDGTLWVECGDSYSGSWSGHSIRPDGGEQRPGGPGFQPLKDGRYTAKPTKHPGCKAKDLIGQPFLLAFALREAGWYWRNVCIWHKPNPMPESVRDRFTVAHSYVLLFSKSPRYFFDAEAVREEADYGRREWTDVDGNMASAGGGRGRGTVRDFRKPPQEDTLDPSLPHEASRGPDGRRATAVKQGDNSIQHRDGERWPNSGRNARSVWTIATEPLPFEHYAAFPQALAGRCIKAGTSERGCCPECGAPWVRVTETERGFTDGKCNGCGRPRAQHVVSAKSVMSGSGGSRGILPPGSKQEGSATRLEDGAVPCAANATLGWRPTCECWRGYPGPTPCTVLDPFGGSGTTGLVSRRLGRRSILVELNEAYCALTAQRTQQLSLEASA